MSFIHLHAHTHYSLLEGTLQPEDLVQLAKDQNMSAIGVADLGNMFGAVDFYFSAKDAGIKPILGAEIFYVTGSRFEKNKIQKRVQADVGANANQRIFHLVLLCQNQIGYKNLCELLTKGYTEGFFGKPRVDKELLKQHSEGLIALTAGIKGEVAYHCATNRPEQAEEIAFGFKEIYKDNLFLEIQDTGLPEQLNANRMIYEIGKKANIPLVATNEIFYALKENAYAQEVHMSIGSGRNLNEERGVRLCPDSFYFKSAETMKQEFDWAPQALENTIRIAELCNFEFKLKDSNKKQIYHLPDFKPSNLKPNETYSVEEGLRSQSETGLAERFKTKQFAELISSPDWISKKVIYEKRLNEELDMIIKTGFSGYFLVVADFIGFAKSNGIPVGPGRGSGAGSLVAYALNITDVDPIEFNLLFERFINPERISLPDFDVDFCQNRRQEVITYVVNKYGQDKVSQIATFGKLMAKGVLRDTSRVLGYSFSDVDPIAKLIPEEIGITLKKAFEKEPKLAELIEKEPKHARLFEIAKQLEGLNRHVSVHAAGVIITNRPLTEYCPLFVGKEGETVVQFDKDFSEKIGLVKFDFLGLKTLTVIDNAVKFIRETENSKGKSEAELFLLNNINYKDQNVFKLISAGDTDGVFQLESSGMKDLCQKVQPSSLEDITAINALYRPGPLNSGMVDDYINRKHGRTEVVYEVPQLKEILEETYGVIVYQEQVMRVARVLANYSLGEADILRRAMGKKKPEEMANQKDKFVSGCKVNKISEEIANKIFDLLAKFAEYGFNKSHSAAYGVLSYQTAFLKNYYPAEFMAAMLATEMNDTDKLSQYIADARSHDIEILPPNINESKKTFSVVEIDVNKKGIRFGLEAIKGVGGVAVDVILIERDQNGAFKNFLDFCNRVALRKVNKRVLESLIASGAFDENGEENRATLFESVESVISHSAKKQEKTDVAQVSFFDQYKMDSFQSETNISHLYKKTPEWTDMKKLQMEKQLVGFYVSGHPIDKWMPLAKNYISTTIEQIFLDFPNKKESALRNKSKQSQSPSAGKSKGGWRREEGPKFDVVTLAMVASFREIVTKKGSKMAFVELEGTGQKIEAICFPEAYEEFGMNLKLSLDECQPFIFTGAVNLDEESPKIFIKTIENVSVIQNRKINQVVLKLDTKDVNTEILAQLRAALVRHSGKIATFLEYTGSVSGSDVISRHALPKELYVNPTAEFAKELQVLFGKDIVHFN